jgi:hypothetical protein
MTAGSPTLVVRGFRYAAGFDGRYDGDIFNFDWNAGSWTEAEDINPGLYFVQVFDTDQARLNASAYSLTVSGADMTSTAPAGAARPLGTMNVHGGSASTGAVTIRPSWDLIGTVTTSHSHWFKFYVTSASDVYVGWTGGATLGGTMYNSKLSKVGSLGVFPSAKHLSAGVYYIKWYLYSGMHSGLYRFSVVGSRVTDHPYATLTSPVLSRVSPKHGTVFAATGYLAPQHAPGTSSATRLMFYRYEHGHWVYKMSRNAAVADYSASKSGYSVSLSLKAGKWYVKARHGDSGHLVSYSAKRYFTVR